MRSLEFLELLRGGLKEECQMSDWIGFRLSHCSPSSVVAKDTTQAAQQ